MGFLDVEPASHEGNIRVAESFNSVLPDSPDWKGHIVLVGDGLTAKRLHEIAEQRLNSLTHKGRLSHIAPAPGEFHNDIVQVQVSYLKLETLYSHIGLIQLFSLNI